MPTAKLVPTLYLDNRFAPGGNTDPAALGDGLNGSYIIGVPGSVATLDLSDPSLPLDAAIVAVRATIEAQALWSSGAVRYASAAINRDAAPIGDIFVALPLAPTPDGGGTRATYVGPQMTAEPITGRAWTQALLNAMHLYLAVVAFDGGTTGAVAISEGYVDVIYATKPTATAVLPSGDTATTRPTVAWNHTAGADGGPQTRYEVRVFSAAQYGAPGFSPATATATWESGIVASPANAALVGVQLVNSTAYRAYVRTAQTINGQPHWSAWHYTAFEVDVEVPPAPDVVAVADDALARIQITATLDGIPLWDFARIERSTDGGATWEPVRSAERINPAGTTVIVYDYESGNGQAVRYRATGITAAGDGDAAGTYGTSDEVMWTSTATWLKSLTQPTLSRSVRIGTLPALTRRKQRGVLRVLGRADPVVVSDVRGTAEGTLTLVTITAAELAEMTALLDLGEPLLLQTPSGHQFGSRYLDFGDVDEDRTVRPIQEASRYWRMPFVEVAAPAGDVVAYGLTWADLIATYDTWQDVIDAFPTWGVLIGSQP